MDTDAGPVLIAVDLGLRTGVAAFGPDGRLLAHRSMHLPDRSALRRAVPRVLRELGPPAHVVVEGDRALGTIWGRAAARHGAPVRGVAPERWREALLHPSEVRGGRAKGVADRVARQIIDWSGMARPTSLRADVAEAICIGLWGCMAVGWLDELPRELRRENRGR